MHHSLLPLHKLKPMHPLSLQLQRLPKLYNMHLLLIRLHSLRQLLHSALLLIHFTLLSKVLKWTLPIMPIRKVRQFQQHMLTRSKSSMSHFLRPLLYQLPNQYLWVSLLRLTATQHPQRQSIASLSPQPCHSKPIISIHILSINLPNKLRTIMFQPIYPVIHILHSKAIL
jgi:hypothetical protein